MENEHVNTFLAAQRSKHNQTKIQEISFFFLNQSRAQGPMPIQALQPIGEFR